MGTAISSDIVLLVKRLGGWVGLCALGSWVQSLLCHSNIMLRNGPPLGETPNMVTCHAADLQVQGKTVKQRYCVSSSSSSYYKRKDANGFFLHVADCYNIAINNKHL